MWPSCRTVPDRDHRWWAARASPGPAGRDRRPARGTGPFTTATFHSAGLVGQLRSDPALTRMNVHWSPCTLAAGEHDPGWTESGSLRLASSPERLVEIRRRRGWAQRAGLPLELISATAARELFRWMGAAYTPTDGQIDPAGAVHRAGGRCARRGRTPGGGVHHPRPGRTGGGSSGCAPIGATSSARPSSSAAACTPPRSRRWWTCGSRWSRCRRRSTSLSRRRCPGGGPGGRCRRCAIPDLLVYYRQEIDGLVMGGKSGRPHPPGRDTCRPPTSTASSLRPWIRPRSSPTRRCGCRCWPTSASVR